MHGGMCEASGPRDVEDPIPLPAIASLRLLTAAFTVLSGAAGVVNPFCMQI